MQDTFKAVLRNSRISPRKLRYVADLIRGKKVNDALDTLRFVPNRGAYMLIKLVKSVIANANNLSPNVDADTLKIVQLKVDTGPIIHRWRATTMGRAVPIKKRTSHVTLLVAPVVEEEKKDKKAPKKTAIPAKKPKPASEKPKPAPDAKPPAEQIPDAAQKVSPAPTSQQQ